MINNTQYTILQYNYLQPTKAQLSPPSMGSAIMVRIVKFSLHFSDNECEFRYTNAQGDKEIPFGVNHNVFGNFPQLGYANEYGAVPTTDGFMYKDAVSFAWMGEREVRLFVQIIDRYFGNMCAQFSFKGDEVFAVFQRAAEHFLNEYQGSLIGKKI